MSPTATRKDDVVSSVADELAPFASDQRPFRISTPPSSNPDFMAHITGLDPTIDHHSSGPKHFFFLNPSGRQFSLNPSAPSTATIGYRLHPFVPSISSPTSTRPCCRRSRRRSPTASPTSSPPASPPTTSCRPHAIRLHRRPLTRHHRHFQHVGKVGVSVARSQQPTPTTD
ncbi:hypothetical protein ACLOJK_023565 [Asimina triloba]